MVVPRTSKNWQQWHKARVVSTASVLASAREANACFQEHSKPTKSVVLAASSSPKTGQQQAKWRLQQQQLNKPNWSGAGGKAQGGDLAGPAWLLQLQQPSKALHTVAQVWEVSQNLSWDLQKQHHLKQKHSRPRTGVAKPTASVRTVSSTRAQDMRPLTNNTARRDMSKLGPQ
jgi:hypothetical protein